MASYNRIILVGNLTRDPQLSYTPSNTAVCKFGVATNNKWKDRDGNTHEDVCFVDCTLFGRSGETFNKHLSKGNPVLVEGRLQLDQWTSPEGEKKSKHCVLVDHFTFLGGGRGGDGGAQGSDGGEQAAPATAAPTNQGAPADDGIPF